MIGEELLPGGSPSHGVPNARRFRNGATPKRCVWNRSKPPRAALAVRRVVRQPVPPRQALPAGTTYRGVIGPTIRNRRRTSTIGERLITTCHRKEEPPGFMREVDYSPMMAECGR